LRRFANKSEVKEFDSLTALDWREKCEKFTGVLLKKATDLGYDSASLSGALKVIQADPDLASVAFVPVGAYVTTLEGAPVWIVVLKWEVPTSPRAQLAHICVYAFTQREIRRVAFATCG